MAALIDARANPDAAVDGDPESRKTMYGTLLTRVTVWFGFKAERTETPLAIVEDPSLSRVRVRPDVNPRPSLILQPPLARPVFTGVSLTDVSRALRAAFLVAFTAPLPRRPPILSIRTAY